MAHWAISFMVLFVFCCHIASESGEGPSVMGYEKKRLRIGVVQSELCFWNEPFFYTSHVLYNKIAFLIRLQWAIFFAPPYRRTLSRGNIDHRRHTTPKPQFDRVFFFCKLIRKNYTFFFSQCRFPTNRFILTKEIFFSNWKKKNRLSFYWTECRTNSKLLSW